MVKKPFFGFGKPKLKYSVLGSKDKESLIEIPLPSRAMLFFKGSFKAVDDLAIRPGDRVKTGQKLRFSLSGQDYFISPVTGTVKAISPVHGDLREASTSVTIEALAKDQWDDEFTRSGRTASLQNVMRFFHSLPGQPEFGYLLALQPPLKTFVVHGLDKDLMITTHQFAVQAGEEEFNQGLDLVKKISGAERIILLVHPRAASEVPGNGVEVKAMDPVYPDTLPKLVMEKVLGRVVPPGQRCEDMGVGFINAEAVMALGSAYATGLMPVNKILTVVKKDGTAVHAKARVGTPVRDVLNALQVGVAHGDRVVLGGPMSGRALFGDDAPVLYDTDGIMVQDRNDIVKNSDTHCVNCGECVRACPAKIPVNMLIRFLENGIWEEAVDRYDLLSCVECGLCSYVCPARIPLFQHIMLGKHEFSRMKSVEGSHA
jgi:electron transport complex protein RnfC